jgi:uncharacterized protein (UPF0297 family)
MDGSMNHTVNYQIKNEEENQAKDILVSVYKALEEKGYNSLNQMVGYLLSGDPTYITSHKNARSKIRKLERDELLEEVLKFYLKEQVE